MLTMLPLLVAAPAALADEMIRMVVGQAGPAGEVYCAVTLLPDGGMTTVLQVMQNSFPAPDQALEATEERKLQFAAIVEAFNAGAFPEATPKSFLFDPNDKRPVPPYVLLVYSEQEGDDVRVAHRVVLPGTEVPPVVLALFGPLHGGACLGP
jgi:hypothetical protein